MTFFPGVYNRAHQENDAQAWGDFVSKSSPTLHWAMVPREFMLMAGLGRFPEEVASETMHE